VDGGNHFLAGDFVAELGRVCMRVRHDEGWGRRRVWPVGMMTATPAHPCNSSVSPNMINPRTDPIMMEPPMIIGTYLFQCLDEFGILYL
jgi:hypothetical protein